MISSSRWTFETLNAGVDDEIAAWPAEVLARFIRAGELITIGCLDSLPAHWIKHLDGKIRELRLQGRDVIGRALYVTATGRRVIVLRAFIKKSQATPPRELAPQRMKDVR